LGSVFGILILTVSVGQSETLCCIPPALQPAWHGSHLADHHRALFALRHVYFFLLLPGGWRFVSHSMALSTTIM
jgi:hypothetical protein